MAGSFTIRVSIFDRNARATLRRAGQANTRQLMEILASEGEAQTRLRISEQKTDPEGKSWEPWSDKYAATRRGGHSLLMSGQDLLDSIQGQATATEAEWGSNLVYFPTHDQGDESRGIPQRQMLGLSKENERDLNDAIEDFFADLLK